MRNYISVIWAWCWVHYDFTPGPNGRVQDPVECLCDDEEDALDFFTQLLISRSSHSVTYTIDELITNERWLELSRENLLDFFKLNCWAAVDRWPSAWSDKSIYTVPEGALMDWLVEESPKKTWSNGK